MSLAYRLSFFACNLLDRIVQRLVVTKASKVCYVSMPDYSDNAYYVYRHMLRTRSNIQHIWLVHSLDSEARISAEFDRISSVSGIRGNSIRVLEKKSLRGYWAYLSSRYLFHTHGGYTFSTSVKRRHVVNLFHGMPIKCIGRLDASALHAVPAFGTLHIATSDLFRYIVALSFGVPVEKVLKTAMPRCDAFFAENIDPEIREKIDELLDCQGKKLILWLPTFRSMARKGKAVKDAASFLDDMDYNLLAALDDHASRYGCVVVVKLHPYDALNFEQRAISFSSIRFLRSDEWLASGIQLYDLTACADGLLSDVSSILIDFLVTGRPIGMIGFNPDTYSRALTISMDDLAGSGCFTAIESSRELEMYFESLGNQTVRPHHRGDMASMLYENPDQCGSEAVLQAVEL